MGARKHRQRVVGSQPALQGPIATTPAPQAPAQTGRQGNRPGTDGGLQTSLAELKAIAPWLKDERARMLLPHLNDSMVHAEIDSDARKAAYLAQLAHESDGFRTLEEYASGADYEGRSDLGNTQPGDGVRFKGRGAIQLTGRANYQRVSNSLGVDLVGQPHLAGTPEYGFLVSAEYWRDHDLNERADKGDFEGITDVINYYDPESHRKMRRNYHQKAWDAINASREQQKKKGATEQPWWAKPAS